MVRVPVLDENIDFVRLDLSRHYNVIDCDFSCYLVLNPNNVPPSMGTDIAVINIGSWQIDTWSFLTKKMFPNVPGFSACLVWDKTLVQDTEQGRKAPRVTESDVDIANSVSSLKGQPVNITGFSLDEGKSLRVSTLELEFCNVKSFPTEYVKDNLFAKRSLFKSLSVGDTFDINDYPLDCVVAIEGGYNIKAPVISVYGKFDNSEEGCLNIVSGSAQMGMHIINSSSYVVNGGASKYSINILISNGVITSLGVKGDFMLVGSGHYVNEVVLNSWIFLSVYFEF